MEVNMSVLTNSVEKINILADNLKKQGYIVEIFETSKDASAFFNKELDNAIIGIGGSQTVLQMNLFNTLAEHNTVYWHDELRDGMTAMETRQAAFRAPVYISSVNAISVNGDIVNIDATGNRVAAISFGPEHVYFVIGKNKITDDFESAMFRARNVAAPLNAKRLKRKTPCAVNADRCYDCDSPERICRNFVTFHKCPYGAKYHVILIDEELGY